MYSYKKLFACYQSLLTATIKMFAPVFAPVLLAVFLSAVSAVPLATNKKSYDG